MESKKEEFEKRKRNKINRYKKLLEKITMPPIVAQKMNEELQPKAEDSENSDLRICHERNFTEFMYFEIPMAMKIKNERILKECLEK
jgi:hypothetical protein